jgi:predicted glycosyltransferase
MGRGGALSLLRELLQRDSRLYRVAREFRPHIMAGIGGIFIAHVGRLTGIPSLIFYDTENATLQNALTYPLASCVIVPRCYQAWLPRRRHIRYAGYHELSYLHPEYFTPDRERAVANGLAAAGDTWLLRTVSWQANHDLGEKGWSRELLLRLTEALATRGKVLISSEASLPAELQAHAYPGDPAGIHHVMAYCRGFIGESATMASECAVLGVPAVYAAETARGYTDEQQARYGLVHNIRHLDWASMQAALGWLDAQTPEQLARARSRLLNDCIDVAAFLARCIETFPEPLQAWQSDVQA